VDKILRSFSPVDNRSSVNQVFHGVSVDGASMGLIMKLTWSDDCIFYL
jgi:hypothetical protein